MAGIGPQGPLVRYMAGEPTLPLTAQAPSPTLSSSGAGSTAPAITPPHVHIHFQAHPRRLYEPDRPSVRGFHP